MSDQPTSKSERLFVLIFGLAIFAGFAASIFVDFEPAKFTAIFIVVFWVPLLVIHEGGHNDGLSALRSLLGRNN